MAITGIGSANLKYEDGVLPVCIANFSLDLITSSKDLLCMDYTTAINSLRAANVTSAEYVLTLEFSTPDAALLPYLQVSGSAGASYPAAVSSDGSTQPFYNLTTSERNTSEAGDMLLGVEQRTINNPVSQNLLRTEGSYCFLGLVFNNGRPIYQVRIPIMRRVSGAGYATNRNNSIQFIAGPVSITKVLNTIEIPYVLELSAIPDRQASPMRIEGRLLNSPNATDDLVLQYTATDGTDITQTVTVTNTNFRFDLNIPATSEGTLTFSIGSQQLFSQPISAANAIPPEQNQTNIVIEDTPYPNVVFTNTSYEINGDIDTTNSIRTIAGFTANSVSNNRLLGTLQQAEPGNTFLYVSTAQPADVAVRRVLVSPPITFDVPERLPPYAMIPVTINSEAGETGVLRILNDDNTLIDSVNYTIPANGTFVYMLNLQPVREGQDIQFEVSNSLFTLPILERRYDGFISGIEVEVPLAHNQASNFDVAPAAVNNLSAVPLAEAPSQAGTAAEVSSEVVFTGTNPIIEVYSIANGWQAAPEPFVYDPTMSYRFRSNSANMLGSVYQYLFLEGLVARSTATAAATQAYTELRPVAPQSASFFSGIDVIDVDSTVSTAHNAASGNLSPVAMPAGTFFTEVIQLDIASTTLAAANQAPSLLIVANPQENTFFVEP